MRGAKLRGFAQVKWDPPEPRKTYPFVRQHVSRSEIETVVCKTTGIPSAARFCIIAGQVIAHFAAALSGISTAVLLLYSSTVLLLYCSPPLPPFTNRQLAPIITGSLAARKAVPAAE
jgi:hypothetical protein